LKRNQWNSGESASLVEDSQRGVIPTAHEEGRIGTGRVESDVH
jgi:hypothetical protein